MRTISLLLLIIIISCTHRFHGDSRLFGEWRPLTKGLPNIYFDSTRYFFMDLDSTKKNAYGLFYRVDNDIITAHTQGVVFSVTRILKITSDTVVLQNEKTNEVVYYVRKSIIK